MLKKWTIAVLVAAAVSLSSCSSGHAGSPEAQGAGAGASDGSSADSAGSAGSSGSVDVCSLLPAAAMTAITGVSYGPPTASSLGIGGCSYQPTDTGKYMGISVWVESGDDASWTSDVAAIKSDDGIANPVSGAGTRAVGGGKEFAAQQGGHIVQVLDGDFDGSTGNPQFPHSIAIANALFGKLS